MSRRDASNRSPVTGRRIAERVADKILDQLELEEPDEIHVDVIASRRGLKTLPSTMVGAKGRLLREGDKGVLAVNPDVVSIAERRWVIAHELGHFELHEAKSQLSVCTSEDVGYGYRSFQGDEAEANAFAANLLMPRRMCGPLCDTEQVTVDAVKQIATLFGVSLTAAAIRYVDLSPERCAVVLSHNNAVVWFRKSAEFGHRIHPRGHVLTDWTYAHDLFRGQSVVDEPQPTRAEAWLESNWLQPEHEITEHSFFSSRYGFALSLIWIPSRADY